MKILLVAIGTRGDVEPFLAQAEILTEAGHEVVCQFPEQFRETVEKLGYQLIGFDKGFLEMLETQSGKAVMGGGGGFKQLKGYLNLIKNSMKIQKLIIKEQRNALLEVKPDKVLFHAKALYHYLAARINPNDFFLLSPLPCLTHPTKEFAHIGLGKWGPFSDKWNLISYKLINGARYKMMRRMMKPYLGDFPSLDLKDAAMRKFEENELKTLYTISPSLFPKPGNWPENAKTTGYFFRNQTRTYIVDPELEKWLKTHPKVILLTFGSMTNPKPEQHSEMLVKLLIKRKIPTIVNLSWGGLQKVDFDSDMIFYVNQIPYDYILPKLYGMIHHGGSGTTHQAAVHGCVQLIIPHIIDQYFWNKLIAKRELGPLGISIHRLKEDTFEVALLNFWQNENYKTNALQLAKLMENEANPTQLLEYLIA
ncbi:glycosyltransferase [Algoriphagus pacificus]|uniref:Glycosyltransferase family 1 protein n=1 Tax=Algoriphagus pacificus TaxID=2811234 RepID=A0ABS3CHF4_9BACT|nr:glycosyltransferase [Algoriphagus pacificus]MBN7816522.1 glycosyltransferase family 1 protein [Algoriphagus pacificus]